MSRYGTPFSDEELLDELNKLGYDDVAPDVFNMMKDDLSGLIEKEQDNLPVSEYEYDDLSPLSSKFLSASSDALIESRTTRETGKKSDPYVSRKVKKKSQKTSSRAVKDRDADIYRLESNKSISNGLKMKSSSNASLDYENIYDENVLSELDDSEEKYDNVNRLKSNDNYLLDDDDYLSRRSKADYNRNEDVEYNGISKSFPSKEDDFELSYSSKKDRFDLNQDVPVTKFKTKPKGSKLTSSWEKSNDPVYNNMSTTRKTTTDNSLKTVKDAFKTFKLDKNYSESNESLHSNYKGSDINLNSSSSLSSEKKTIKRKVLRRRNGRSVITEELVEIPSIFDTSYPESENFNSSKSFSSDDLSYKSNNSTGSIIAVSPESSIKSSPSSISLLSTRSTSLRVPNTRKKKSDPVAMYGYYRKFWENFKPPGENTHDRLRWAVRDKMLEYNI